MSKIKIISRLKKMMLHERSARLIGNEKEADLYAEKIAALREKHHITQEIPLETEEVFNSFGGEAVFMPDSPKFRKKRIIWEEAVFSVVCIYFGCHPIVQKRSNIKVMIGEKADRARVRRTYLHLTELAEREVKTYVGKFPASTAAENRLRRESFLHGFASITQQRIHQFIAARAKLDEIERTTGERPARFDSSQAIVPAQKIIVPEERQAVEREVAEVKEAPPPVITKMDEGAFLSGQMTGAACPLNEELALPAAQSLDDLEEVTERLRRRQRRQIFWGGFTSATTSSTFASGTIQISFNFEE